MEQLTFNKEKRLIEDAQSHPLRAIRGVFDHNNRDFLREILRKWLCVTLKLGKFSYLEANEQARLVFFHDQLLLLIDALFFIVDENDPEEQFLQDYKKGIAAGILPEDINDEQKGPASVIAAFFRIFTLQYIKAELWDWLRTVLVANHNELDFSEKEAISWMYDDCLALVEAAYALHLRTRGKETSKPDDPIKQDANVQAGSAKPAANSLPAASPIEDFMIKPEDKGDHMREILTKVVEVCQPDKIFLLSNYFFFESPLIIVDLLVLLPEPVSREMYRSYQQQIESALAPIASVICALDHSARVCRLFEQGHIFYSSVCRKEHLLYDNRKAPLPVKGDVKPGPIIETAKRVFYRQFDTAMDFLETARYFNGKCNRAMVAFQLSQACLHILYGFLTALTGYKYRTSDIGRLVRLTFRITNLLNVFWIHVDDQKRLLGLLNKAHSQVRYPDWPGISPADMPVLFERVNQLAKAAKQEFEARLASFRHWH